jgi:cell division protein FtsL
MSQITGGDKVLIGMVVVAVVAFVAYIFMR